MIETKLLIGRYIQFQRPTWRDLPSIAHVPDFVTVNCPRQTLQESTPRSRNPFSAAAAQRVSSVAQGTNPAASKLHRNFKFLPWYQGDISETVLDQDVLTGPMSGCIIVRYRRNGSLCVGHIGTVTVTDDIPESVNTNVKRRWTDFMTNEANPGDIYGGFNPTARTVKVHPPAQAGDIAGETWALVTTGGRYYSVQVYKQAGIGVNEWRVAAIEETKKSMTPAELRKI
jgi:hypothetical protein